jgi:hypothetical protein
MSRTLLVIAAIAVAVLTGPIWLPLATSPALDSIVLSPGFTTVAVLGAVVVTIAPVLAVAFMIHDARSSGRREPEGGK